MQSFKCPKCKTEISLEKRAHICPATRSLRGEMVGTLTVYRPNIGKPNKQVTQEGYVKRWGSKAKRNNSIEVSEA